MYVISPATGHQYVLTLSCRQTSIKAFFKPEPKSEKESTQQTTTDDGDTNSKKRKRESNADEGENEEPAAPKRVKTDDNNTKDLTASLDAIPAIVREEILQYVKEPSWMPFFLQECAKPYVTKLAQFLREERSKFTIYPRAEHVFTAFNVCPVDRIKVVILGQDPYFNPNQAHGLSFSVLPGVPPPPSLRNIYKELQQEYPDTFVPPKHGCLLHWARQGVFLLNAVLTVRKGEANSHNGKGWNEFTDAAVKYVNNKCDHVVFILWGNFAQKKEKSINISKHYVLKGVHPSPMVRTGFVGCGHFIKANKWLESKGITPIDWTLPQTVSMEVGEIIQKNESTEANDTCS